MEGPLGSAGVFFHPISTAPIVLPPEDAAIDPSHLQSSEIGEFIALQLGWDRCSSEILYFRQSELMLLDHLRLRALNSYV